MGTIARRIAHTGTAFLAAYFVLALMATYWHIVRAGDVAANPIANAGRMQQEELRVARGRILDRHGAVLAETEILPSGERERRYAPAGANHAVGYYSARFGTGGVEAA